MFTIGGSTGIMNPLSLKDMVVSRIDGLLKPFVSIQNIIDVNGGFIKILEL
jgi:hypothetical protein